MEVIESLLAFVILQLIEVIVMENVYVCDPKMQFGNTMNWQPQVTMPRRLS